MHCSFVRKHCKDVCVSVSIAIGFILYLVKVYFIISSILQSASYHNVYDCLVQCFGFFNF